MKPRKFSTASIGLRSVASGIAFGGSRSQADLRPDRGYPRSSLQTLITRPRKAARAARGGFGDDLIRRHKEPEGGNATLRQALPHYQRSLRRRDGLGALGTGALVAAAGLALVAAAGLSVAAAALLAAPGDENGLRPGGVLLRCVAGAPGSGPADQAGARKSDHDLLSRHFFSFWLRRPQ